MSRDFSERPARASKGDTPGRDGAPEVMRREMQVRLGSVPDQLNNPAYRDSAFEMTHSEFLYRTPGGAVFHYAPSHRLPGEGLVAHLPDESLQDEFQLYLWGTVFGAVAWFNGFFPLHASAVALGGRAVAFTADSGGGKSTLAAALAARPGLGHVCDDTLVLDTREGGILAVPDGKPIKLWDDAFALAGATRHSPILTVPGKFYARPASLVEQAVPLTDLVFLSEGDTLRLDPVTGAAKLALLTQALYRAFVHAGLNDDATHARMMTRIAGKVRFWRLSRTRNPDEFTTNLKEIEKLVRDMLALG